MYDCTLCNYSNKYKKNLMQHVETKLHLNNEINNKMCFTCNRTYKSLTSFKKHKQTKHNSDTINIVTVKNKKSATIKNNTNTNNTAINNSSEEVKLMLNNINDKIDIKINDVKDKIDNKINDVKDKINDVQDNIDYKINDVKEEINNSKKEVVTVVNKAINKASSLIKYLMENHKSVPPLKKITRNQCISTLRLDYNCPEKDKDYSLQQLFIKDYARNLFIPNIAKSILKMINYKNKDTQPIYNTDSTRQNYVVKLTSELWNEDKSGIKFTDYIIRPLLRYIRDLVEEYIEEDLDKINMYKNTAYENELLLDEKEKAYTFDIALTNDYLIKPLLKELSPYLRFLQLELEEIEKLEELEKIQEDLQEIINKNNDSYNDNYNSNSGSNSDSNSDNYYNNITINNYDSDNSDNCVYIKKITKRLIK